MLGVRLMLPIVLHPLTLLVDRDDIRAAKAKVRAQGCAFLILPTVDDHTHDPASRT